MIVFDFYKQIKLCRLIILYYTSILDSLQISLIAVLIEDFTRHLRTGGLPIILELLHLTQFTFSPSVFLKPLNNIYFVVLLGTLTTAE